MFSTADSVIRRTLEFQTQQQMALTVVGIQRYRLRTGRFPSGISDLIPEYLASVPNDFMNGKPLKYQLRPGGKDFLLYSVGEDGKDDSGDPAPKDERTYRQIWNGRDAVWPTAASAAEAEMAGGIVRRE
jgi:hypothetical protein